MSEVEYIKKLSELEPATKEYSKLLDELVENHWPEPNKSDYFMAKKKIKDDGISQDNYKKAHKGKKILSYDTENFMPIFSGVKKWVSEQH